MSVSGAAPSMTCTMLLVRHAHTEMEGRFCGEIDPPLSNQGRQQLPGLAEGLEKYPLTDIFSSDLLRSRETANFIAAKSALTLELLSGLRELRFGEWEGLDWDEVSRKDPAYAERWMQQYPRLSAPGGEDFEGFRGRVQRALAEVADRSSGGCAAVVTHGGVIRTFMLDVLDLPESALASLAYGYASCVEVVRRAGRWYLRD